MGTQKRMLYVCSKTGEGADSWQGVSDEEAEQIRQQVRQQLLQEVPVVVLPPGYWLSTIDLEAPEEEKRAKKNKEA